MEYKAVFFDVDGTILNLDKKIPLTTKEAVRKLKEKGIEVFIATGRSYNETINIMNELEIESIVSDNGSNVVYKNKEIFKTSFVKEEITKLVQEANKNMDAVSFQDSKSIFYSDYRHPIVKKVLSYHYFDGLNYINNLEEMDDYFKLALYTNEHENVKKYEEKLKDLKFIKWNTTTNEYCYDVLRKENSKFIGIQKALSHLDIKKEEAIAFGDAMNDVEMVSNLGLGIAMGNSTPDLIPHANFVTKHVNDDGILYALEKFNII